MKNHLTIYFLTSRHTQHQIAINTIKDIKEHHNVNIITTDIIGKKWMCIQPSVDALYSNEFNEYCKALKEENKCEFYSNTKTQDNKVSVEAKKTLNELKVLSPYHTEQVIKTCEVEKLCPHEISTLLAKKIKRHNRRLLLHIQPSNKKHFLQKSRQTTRKRNNNS